MGHTFDSVLVLATAIHNMIPDGYNMTITESLEFGVIKGGSTVFSKIGETLLDYIFTNVNTSGAMAGYHSRSSKRLPSLALSPYGGT